MVSIAGIACMTGLSTVIVGGSGGWAGGGFFSFFLCPFPMIVASMSIAVSAIIAVIVFFLLEGFVVVV